VTQSSDPGAVALIADRARTMRLGIGCASGLGGALQVLRVGIAARRPEAGAESEPMPVAMRALGGGEIWVRPGTTDIHNAVLYYSASLHLPPPGIRDEELKSIVEIGTNMGAGLAALAYRYPQAQLIGVEPDPLNAAVARRNLEPFGGRAQVVQSGVWPTDGDLVIEDSYGEGAHGLAVREATPDDPPEARIEAKTIDSILAETKTESVDYMHVTAEETTRELMRAGGEWAAKTRSMCVETQPQIAWEREDTAADLRALGFRVVDHPTVPHKWVYAIRD
jgi:FkbM family methyltransferase